jgi:predicted small lipoprotein YifL
MRKISILIVLVLLTACGVKGPPRPPDLTKKAPAADGGVVDGGE